MSLLDNWNWTWPAIALAFCLGAIATRLLYKRFGSNKKKSVNADYFKGLNFLLNEETDKAIESFIKALEVDNETVELHLALGGLFRRKGQVDRATRIHQNLIARPNLTERQRYEGIYELAQDYYKAGWLDRAEGLFDELKGSETYHAQAINGLCGIYQQEKEWKQAIDILNQHKPTERAQHAKQVAHYFCELAEIALENLDYQQAAKYLRSAAKEEKGNARILSLKGELAFQQHNYADALANWMQLRNNNESALQLVTAKMIRCFKELENQQGLTDFLKSLNSIPKRGKDFKAWYSALLDVLGEQAAEAHLVACVEAEGLSGPVANHLHSAVETQAVDNALLVKLLKELLNRAKSRKIEYTCSRCGFDTKAMYWYCQNCGEWESFR